jgi:hypothetical protein
MNQRPSRLFFDRNDYKLLSIVNDVLKRGSRPQSLSSLMAPYMHPHGIKEMAAPSGLRIAYAIVSCWARSRQARPKIVSPPCAACARKCSAPPPVSITRIPLGYWCRS